MELASFNAKFSTQSPNATSAVRPVAFKYRLVVEETASINLGPMRLSGKRDRVGLSDSRARRKRQE